MVTFRVDKVSQAEDRLATVALGERLRDALTFGGDPSTQVTAHGRSHALLAAVGMAFAQHRPLVLSPDVVWLTIAQGVAQHVRLHAERLRSRLVRHDGRKRLAVEVLAMPSNAASWSAIVSAFRDRLVEEVGDGRARLFECSFSTTTEVERIASQIVLLDVYSPYFEYWMVCVCGIPSITLTGTVADWQDIRARIDIIVELDLELWCRSLVPIADQLVRAAAGDVDLAFWQRIYNPVDAYGGKLITGWITRLYPYLESEGRMELPNPMLELAINEPRDITTSKRRRYSGPGLSSDSIPNTHSRVTIHVVYPVGAETLALVAGVVAVAQDDSGALRPIVGWHLERSASQISAVLDRIEREHWTQPATEDSAQESLAEGPAELIAMDRRFASATLFAGDRAWQILPCSHRQEVSIFALSPDGVKQRRELGLTIQRVIDLPGGNSICYVLTPFTRVIHWLVCRLDAPAAEPRIVVVDRREVMLPNTVTMDEAPEEIRLLGGSLAAVLEAALDSGGEIDHLDAGRLAQLLPRPWATGV